MNNVTQLPKQSLIEQEQKSTCEKSRYLPPELWDAVIEYASVKDRIICMAVSRHFREAAMDENFWSKVIREKLEPNELDNFSPLAKFPLDSKTSFHCIAGFFGPSKNMADRSIRHIFLSRLGLSTLERAYKEAKALKPEKDLTPGLYSIYSYIISEHINNNDLKAAQELIDQVEQNAQYDQLVSRYESVRISYIKNHCKNGQLKEAMVKYYESGLTLENWFVVNCIMWLHLDSSENRKQLSQENQEKIYNDIIQDLQHNARRRGDYHSLKRRRRNYVSILAKECSTTSQLVHMQKLVRKFASDLIDNHFDVIQFNISIRDLDAAWKKTLELPAHSDKRKNALSMMINVFRRAGNMAQAELASTYFKDEYPSVEK